MKFIFSVFLLLFVFEISVYSQSNDPAPTYAGGAARGSGGESFGGKNLSLNEIKNKILTDLFFRGKVADGFIDANLYEKIPGAKGKAYAEIREALILWIGDNPDEAAEIFFDSYGIKVVSGTVKIKYSNLKRRLNPHFLQLIKNLSASAKNFSLDDESLTMAGRRLFEGLIARPDYANVDMPSFMPREEGGLRDEFDFADFKLNHAQLEQETKNMTLWVSSLKNNIEKKIYQAKKSAGYDNKRIRALYVKTFKLYKTFIVRTSCLKGRENITAKESSGLEKERFLLRKSLTVLQLLMEYGKLNLQRKIFNEKHPNFAFLAYDSEQTLGKILEFLNKIERGDVKIRELNSGAYEIYARVENSILKNNFYLWLIAFKKSADSIKFSCAYDFLMFTHLKTIKPLPDYVALRNQLQKDSDKIEELLFKIKNGKENEMFALMAQNKARGNNAGIMDTLKKMKESFKKSAEFSAANKKVQRIFWDGIFNPFKIYMDKSGKMKIRVNYFIMEAL